MPAALLTTKFFVPPTRVELVPRPGLMARLNAGLHHKLTLVSAPAGFGKTTLLSAWLRQAEPRTQVAWLSLDEADNDLPRFLTYFIVALQTAHTQIGQELLAALQSPGTVNTEAGLNTLLNEITELPDEVVIILDDFQVIESPPIDRALTFLLDHLPANMHVVIATRADPALPLARLRGRGQLNELRTADLRFTLDEVIAFLNQVMGLGLATEDIAALDARTEGWIAGLQLAALSMQQSSDVRGFIRSFTGSHHHILDYLVEEVLSKQAPNVQSFLMQTSILERLSGPLCDAVCTDEIDDEDKIDGQTMLEHLAKSNLFIVSLDDERCWYRYHHLFSELLQARLMRLHPDQISALHLHAAEWYEKNGWVAEAVDHAFSGGEYDRAASLIEQLASRTMNHGHVTTILRWLDALPKKILHARPRLCIYRAWALSMTGQPRAAEKILLEVKASLAGLPSSAENRALRGELSAILAGIITSHNDPAEIIDEAEEALAYLPEENLLSRARASLALGIAYAYSDEIQKAMETYQQTRDLAHKAGNPFLATVAIELLAGIQIYHQGRLKDAAQNLEQALELGRRTDGTYYAFTGLAHSLLAEIYLEWNNLEAATRYLDTGLELVQRAGIGHSLIHTYCAQARLQMYLGESDRAVEALRSADQATKANPLVQFLIHNLACQVKLALHLGDTKTALRWARGNQYKLPERLPAHLHEFQQISLARVYLAQGDFKKVSQTLDRIQSQADSAGRVAHVIEICLMKALAFGEQSISTEAMEWLDSALRLASSEGYVQTFIEFGAPMARLLREAGKRSTNPAYINTILSALDEHHELISPSARTRPGRADRVGTRASNQTTVSLIEPLTNRELQVLCLMAEGLTYNEIADRILVSLNTVRTHVKNIYGKLLVHKRSKAIAKARNLNIL